MNGKTYQAFAGKNCEQSEQHFSVSHIHVKVLEFRESESIGNHQKTHLNFAADSNQV